MSFEFSDKPRFIWLYHFDGSGIFVGTQYYLMPENTGLPASCTDKPCLVEPGKIGVWDGKKWGMVPDLRGTQYWDKYGNEFIILELTSLPEWAITSPPPEMSTGYVPLFRDGAWQQIEDFTGKVYYSSNGEDKLVSSAWFELPPDCSFTPPLTEWDVWNGSEWVTDVTAQKTAVIEGARQAQQALLKQADRNVELLHDAEVSGMSLKGDAEKLIDWKKYRVLLSRVDVNLAPDIEWPPLPSNN